MPPDAQKKLRPFFSFYGGKWRAAPHYPAPRYETIIEPFAGSAGYSMRYPGHNVILVERDPYIAGTWRYLLRVQPQEILALPDIEASQSVDDLEVCQEARWLIGWWINQGAAAPYKTPSAWMRSGQKASSWWGPEIRTRIASQLHAIRHWTLIEGDYTEAPNTDATWFIDPPYAVMGKYYRFSQIDYPALADWCGTLRGQALVCENVGADWLPFRTFRDIQATTTRYGGKVSREAIWTNDAP